MRAREEPYNNLKDYQTELRIFIRFEVVDTLGSSQVLFWYQDFPPSQTVLSLQGLGILRRARGGETSINM